MTLYNAQQQTHGVTSYTLTIPILSAIELTWTLLNVVHCTLQLMSKTTKHETLCN